MPVEISKEILLRMTEELHETFPDLRLLPVCMDFTQDLDLPVTLLNQHGKKVVFFPGSTIGNFSPHEAVDLFKEVLTLNRPWRRSSDRS